MYFWSIIVLCFLFLQIFGRPTHVLQDYDKDSNENSYRDSESSESDDDQHNEQKSSLKQFAGESAPKAEFDENSPGTNEEIHHAHPDKDYLENDEEQTDTQLSRDDLSTSNDVKRTASYNNGIILFHDNEKPHKLERNECNVNDEGKSNHDRYLKQYNLVHNVDRDALIRDKRHSKNNNLNEPIGTDEISTQNNELSGSEDEETAIRRHVKKLSKEELDELLHSLSEDKRALLKNIIDNYQQEYDSINKREITKKAGAKEENSFVGNEQSDTSKIQGGSANLQAEASMAPNLEKEDNTKKTDSDSMYTKSAETANCPEKSNDKMTVLDSIADKIPLKLDSVKNMESSQTESKILGNSDTEKETSKKENKREIISKSFVESESNKDESAIIGSSNNDDYCSDNEGLSQLWKDENNLYNDDKYKREICSDDLDSLKSLEESFPNSNTPNKRGSVMAPLIRVKRNNPDKVIEKRDMSVVSNIKVPYFSSALENNEESDEAGEFQNDGFFDRNVNLAKSGDLVKRGTDISKGSGDINIKYCNNKNKLQSETVGLGSDTDVVLSGIEGVDDNMMYNSVARIRRTEKAFDNINTEGEAGKFKQENKHFSSQNNDNEISEEYNNAAHYQEHDAFGSLPRNYERDLERFKRIRRLKPENVSGEK